MFDNLGISGIFGHLPSTGTAIIGLTAAASLLSQPQVVSVLNVVPYGPAILGGASLLVSLGKLLYKG
jgi:hypothetical protein